MKEPVTPSLPSPNLFKVHGYIVAAAGLLSGSDETGLRSELLRVAQELRERERQATDPRMPGEDE